LKNEFEGKKHGEGGGTFQSVSWLNSDILSAIFRQQVLEMMLQKRRLTPAFAHKISHWRHSRIQFALRQASLYA